MSSEPIELLVPFLPSADEILPWLKKVDESRQYTNFGPLCRLFEQELCKLSNAPFVVSMSSCTLGLELALATLNIRPGGRVVLPALTFPASASAIIRAGLTPVFADIDAQTLSLSVNTARQVTTKSVIDAVLPVSIHGHVYDVPAWDAFSAEHGVPVLIDAASSAGYQEIGSTTSAVFSLHATKPLAIGEGGFLATANRDLADKVRAKSNFGIQSGQARLIGTNAKLSEYNAAVGLAAVKTWPSRKLARQALYEAYATTLDHPELRSAVSLATRSSASPNLCVRLHGGIESRDLKILAEDGIETRRWYWPPLHHHAAFAHCERAGALTTTESISKQLLGLPFHLGLTLPEIIRIGKSLRKIVALQRSSVSTAPSSL
jgi:dTDP-4-amino-4,6-dideoxygalactose transaminase